jgi:rubrerythrin
LCGILPAQQSSPDDPIEKHLIMGFLTRTVLWYSEKSYLMSTKENLKAGFAGESQANRKYSSFSEKAAEEGFPTVAKLFRAASEAEAIHAKRHLSVYGVPSTLDNLKASVEGETEEFESMYPGFIKESQAEGNADATRSFTFAMKAEEVHAGLYKKAVESVQAGKDLTVAKVLLCPTCGNVALDQAPGACPICGVPGSKWKEITL